MEYPDSFWAVKCACTVHRVSEQEAKIVRNVIQDRESDPGMHPDLFQLEDIYGGKIYIDLKSVSGVWESTPELRERESIHQKQLEKEWEREF